MSGFFTKELIALFIAGMITENLLFARALGVDRISERTRNYRDILSFCGCYFIVTLAACSMAWGFRHLWMDKPWWNDGKGMVILLCIAVAYLGLSWVIGIDRITARSAPLIISFNGASFGAVFIAISTMNTSQTALIYCVASSIGLLAAMMLIHSGRERLALCNVPRSFAGIPITMIYIGIIGLAIYGLVGHQLPT